MDLHMLTLLPGHERTAAQYERLLKDAGLRMERVVPTGSPSGIAIIETKPSPDPITRL
jgi:hypothetical protein